MADFFEHSNNSWVEDKCGEIFRTSQNNFIIICTECQDKHCDFQEFAKHFREVHNFEETVFNENKLDIKDEEEKISQDFLRNNTITAPENADEKLPTKSKSRQKKSKRKCQKPKTPLFESIKLEQPCTILNAYNDVDDDEDFVEDKDLLQTDDAKYDEVNEENENSLKNKKIELELRKTNHFCEECEKGFISASQLKQHIRKKHILDNSNKFKCTQCDVETFSDERSLKKHIRVQHQGGGFKCTYCERNYKSASSLREHMLTHRDTNDFLCNFQSCGKSFKSSTKLRRHQRVHEGNFRHVCEICGYRTREKHVLVVHLRTHTGERPYPCNICGKHFISQPMVKEHQATHAVQRNHECEVCGATFSAPKALYHHKHLHLGIKKFICRICDKAYSQAAGLSAHMRQHKVDGKIM